MPIQPAQLKKIREAEALIMEEAMQQLMASEQDYSPIKEHETSGKEKESDTKDLRHNTSAGEGNHLINGIERKYEFALSNRSRDSPSSYAMVTDDKIENGKEKQVESAIRTQRSLVVKKEDLQFDKDVASECAVMVEQIQEEPKRENTVEPLGIRESQVSELLEYYQSIISPKLIQSYTPCTELLEKAQSGFEPYWLCFTSSDYAPESKSEYSKIRGLAVFHVDPTSKLRVRVNILHASCEPESMLKEFLEKVLQYIWNNVNCDEIRVGLAHIEQAGEKYIPYDPLKNLYQELQFRWKTLTNDELGKRILVLGLNRPVAKVFTNPRYIIFA